MNYKINDMKSAMKYSTEDFSNVGLYKRKSFTKDILLNNLNKIDFGYLIKYNEPLAKENIKELIDFATEFPSEIKTTLIRNKWLNAGSSNFNKFIFLIFTNSLLNKETYLYLIDKIQEKKTYINDTSIFEYSLFKKFTPYCKINDLEYLYEKDKEFFLLFMDFEDCLFRNSFYNIDYNSKMEYIKKHPNLLFDFHDFSERVRGYSAQHKFSNDFLIENFDKFTDEQINAYINGEVFSFDELPEEFKEKITEKILMNIIKSKPMFKKLIGFSDNCKLSIKFKNNIIE